MQIEKHGGEGLMIWFVLQLHELSTLPSLSLPWTPLMTKYLSQLKTEQGMQQDNDANPAANLQENIWRIILVSLELKLIEKL